MKRRTLRNTLNDLSNRPNDVDAQIWKAAKEILHPGYYGLLTASAKEAKASVAAGEAAVQTLLNQMMNGYDITEAKTGI